MASSDDGSSVGAPRPAWVAAAPKRLPRAPNVAFPLSLRSLPPCAPLAPWPPLAPFSRGESGESDELEVVSKLRLRPREEQPADSEDEERRGPGDQLYLQIRYRRWERDGGTADESPL